MSYIIYTFFHLFFMTEHRATWPGASGPDLSAAYLAALQVQGGYAKMGGL